VAIDLPEHNVAIGLLVKMALINLTGFVPARRHPTGNRGVRRDRNELCYWRL
jgi:hypothetical protein